MKLLLIIQTSWCLPNPVSCFPYLAETWRACYHY